VLRVLVLVSALAVGAVVARGRLLHESSVSPYPMGFADWSKLEVTFGSFDLMPMTAAAATALGWSANGSCGDSQVNFVGNRYILDGDISLMLIFDDNGNLNAIQNGVYNQPQPEMTPPWEQAQFPSGAIYWTLTFYLVDPLTMCGKKPHPTGDFTVRGDRVWLKDGNNSGYYYEFPLAESDVASYGWVQGRCFVGMGDHWWYNISANMDCDYFFPVFLIYNGGKLNVFGPNIGVGPAQTSSRWEHPGGSVLYFFFQTATLPKCLFDHDNLSTMHIYLNSPLTDNCVLKPEVPAEAHKMN